MVCEQSLAQVANTIGLGQHLLLGHGEEQGGGRTRVSILADAVESVIAACYLDGGFEPAKAFIDRFVLCNVPVKQLHNRDFKTAFQELVQRQKDQLIRYTLIGEEGPDHCKQFRVAVTLNGKTVGEGTGTSKKRAEQAAACAAMEALYPEEV
jgi:ribonuclease-3